MARLGINDVLIWGIVWGFGAAVSALIEADLLRYLRGSIELQFWQESSLIGAKLMQG